MIRFVLGLALLALAAAGCGGNATPSLVSGTNQPFVTASDHSIVFSNRCLPHATNDVIGTFVEIDNVKGTAAYNGFKDAIAATGFSFDSSKGQLTFSAQSDRAEPEIFGLVTQGTAVKRVRLTVLVRTISGKPGVLMTLEAGYSLLTGVPAYVTRFDTAFDPASATPTSQVEIDSIRYRLCVSSFENGTLGRPQCADIGR